MINERKLAQLVDTRQRVNKLVEGIDDQPMRTQYHPDLSPLGWHLGHCVFTESYWIQEVVCGDNANTAPLAKLYVPPITPKKERGARLAEKKELLGWSVEQQKQNLNLLISLQPDQHPLLENDYLISFLIQHYCQHYETMIMVLTQRAMKPDIAFTGEPLRASAPDKHTVALPPGSYRIGGSLPSAYDNELPAHNRVLVKTGIAEHPATNAEYLGFVEDDGYERAEFWSPQGWQWRNRNAIDAPLFWKRNQRGGWYGIGVNGSQALVADEPVCSISQHEALAYANWAGGRLPDEYEWESACREKLLSDTGLVWEWCANAFQPYKGFQAFPYPEYSQPWFDGQHFTLRGGSRHTLAPIKRPSFRNFYAPEIRYLFSGVRVAYS